MQHLKCMCVCVCVCVCVCMCLHVNMCVFVCVWECVCVCVCWLVRQQLEWKISSVLMGGLESCRLKQCVVGVINHTHSSRSQVHSRQSARGRLNPVSLYAMACVCVCKGNTCAPVVCMFVQGQCEYFCVCVCVRLIVWQRERESLWEKEGEIVCVCERERERERKRKKKRKK